VSVGIIAGAREDLVAMASVDGGHGGCSGSDVWDVTGAQRHGLDLCVANIPASLAPRLTSGTERLISIYSTRAAEHEDRDANPFVQFSI
jgi:NAD(P)H-hydrate repair Nnr-like enzyme with NAD(P)H-hydrate dehydratase domain